MKNLSAINHNHFSRLFEVTNSYNKATLLDKFIYWWQISTFTLPNDPHTWFTRSRERIAEESKLSLRTVDRYLNEFAQKGFIEKTNKLLLKKHLYIRITDKLLVMLGLSNQERSRAITPTPTTLKPTQVGKETKTACATLGQHGSIDFANLAVSIYKEKDNNLINNTVRGDCHVNQTENKATDSILPPHPHSENLIKKNRSEQLPPQLSNYIKGIINNLKNQHGLKTSAPEQLYAEIEYSVLNKAHQFVGIEDNVHRLNLIAKLLRENRWRTPKGFFNYSASGKHFKQSIIDNENRWLKTKTIDATHEAMMPSRLISENNMGGNTEVKRIQQEVRDIDRLLHTETCYYNEMNQHNDKKPSQIVQMVIDATIIKLNHMRDKQTKLKEKLHEYKAA